MSELRHLRHHSGKEIGITRFESEPSGGVDPSPLARGVAKQTRHGLRGPYIDRSRETLNKLFPLSCMATRLSRVRALGGKLNFADLRAYTLAARFTSS